MEVEWRVAMRPGRRRKLEPGSEEAPDGHSGTGEAVPLCYQPSIEAHIAWLKQELDDLLRSVPGIGTFSVIRRWSFNHCLIMGPFCVFPAMITP